MAAYREPCGSYAFGLKNVADCRIYDRKRMIGFTEPHGRGEVSEGGGGEVVCSVLVFGGGRFRPLCSKNGSPAHGGCHISPAICVTELHRRTPLSQIGSHRLTQSVGPAAPVIL